MVQTHVDQSFKRKKCFYYLFTSLESGRAEEEGYEVPFKNISFQEITPPLWSAGSGLRQGMFVVERAECLSGFSVYKMTNVDI